MDIKINYKAYKCGKNKWEHNKANQEAFLTHEAS